MQVVIEIKTGPVKGWEFWNRRAFSFPPLKRETNIVSEFMELNSCAFFSQIIGHGPTSRVALGGLVPYQAPLRPSLGSFVPLCSICRR